MGRRMFYIVDVFAEKKFSGNQLAVVRVKNPLSDDMMQRIAKEINFSETTFVFSDTPRDGGYDVRIFTPGQEVPFAGHPTLGTAHVIRNEVARDAIDRIVLNLKVGQIPVTFGRDEIAWMKQPEPSYGKTLDRNTLVPVLGLALDEIDTRFPIEEVSTGLPHIIVPLKTLQSLKKARVNKDRYFELIKKTWAKPILIFCPEPHEKENDISVRMFADAFGIPEDPATGSGNGCLAGYLVKHRYFEKPKIDIRSEQGYEIGRPSLLYLRASDQDGRISISVGGKVVMIAKGELV